LKSWREECGVFGVWNDRDASRLTYLGLYALQHRGQESAGIVSLEGNQHHEYRNLGLVGDVFKEENLQQLPGTAAIGHVRYSTTGRNLLVNAQPLTAQLSTGPLAIAHNGNIVNSATLKDRLKSEGAIFSTTNDTEVFLHLLARHPSTDLIECLRATLPALVGAYSLLMLARDCIVACRDPYGFRPLILGERQNELGEKSYILSSETCAFDLIGAQAVREIEPGEIVRIDAQGVHSERFASTSHRRAQCVFEHVYFARPDSTVFGRSVYETRKKLGEILARETAVAADVVIPVPDSGVPAAIGYSKASQIPFEFGIIRNHYVGRTFIQPQQSIRSFGVKVKLNPQSAVLKGKRVIVVDDSLVRGTTSKKIVNLIRQAGAREVHLRISAPPTTGPCYYGVDTPERSQLIASQKSLEEIRQYVEADTLGYLSEAGLMEAVGNSGYCAACFNGQYPTPLDGVSVR
jgi:amidophosphoribosyltransferase